MKRKRSSESELPVSSSAAAAAAFPVRRVTKTVRTRKNPSEVESHLSATPAPVAQVIEVAIVSEPTYEAVAALAYSFWEARGCQGGSPEEDWIRAERQLRAHTA